VKPSSIDKLIINSPYEEPTSYWSYDRENRSFAQKDGRRPAGYVVASEKSKSFDDPGIFIEKPIVNSIRPVEDGLPRQYSSEKRNIPVPSEVKFDEDSFDKLKTSGFEAFRKPYCVQGARHAFSRA